jgi:pyridoxine kinase
MKNHILLINDLPGYGKVALSAMVPVLSNMGFNLYNLPTALVSNTLDYGKFEILDTTGYMKNTIKVWEELGFGFDAISTGFIVSGEQVRLIADYCKEQALTGTRIFVDPIMGDDGKLYNGIAESTVDHMRELCAVADYIVPNYTEACFLAGIEPKPRISETQGIELIDALRKLGSESVVVTSVNLLDHSAVMGFDAAVNEYFTLPFEYIPVRFPGTGDIFSAVMMGSVLSDRPLVDSVSKAMEIVRQLILMNVGNVDKFKGIPIEASLNQLDI